MYDVMWAFLIELDKVLHPSQCARAPEPGAKLSAQAEG